MKKIEKAFAISDAKISFMSLVDKAANKREFLITKAKDGKANFTTAGRIIKVDSANHYVTGIAYEPMIEDAHGNYMTEDEIVKAAYWFQKNGDKVDLQHSFEELSGACVVENWVTKSEEVIGDTTVQKGTWLITVEVTDSDVWDQIEKGELTGFSMGGVGKYSVTDDDISDGEEVVKMAEHTEKTEKKGIFKKLADAFGAAGYELVEKGEMADLYAERQKSSGFWNAMNTLEVLLSSGHYDYNRDIYVYDFEDDEERIRTALQEFSTIVTDLLTEKSITKTLLTSLPEKPITKAGKKMSNANKKKLTDICDALTAFSKEFDEAEEQEQEEKEVKKEDVQKMIEESITKALNSDPTPATPAAPAATTADEPVTAEAIQKMVADTVAKAMQPKEPTAEDVQKMVEEAVTKAIEPVLKARGLPTAINDGAPITKQDEQSHYLHGLL